MVVKGWKIGQKAAANCRKAIFRHPDISDWLMRDFFQKEDLSHVQEFVKLLW